MAFSKKLRGKGLNEADIKAAMREVRALGGRCQLAKWLP